MIASLEEINRIIDSLPPNKHIILLKGDLASGKTTFVKYFVKSKGVNVDVSSPTFSIMNSYDDKIFHYDIYNHGVAKFIESGLLENLELDGYHLIEWADERLEEILKSYGFDYVKVEIIPISKTKREYKICTN